MIKAVFDDDHAGRVSEMTQAQMSKTELHDNVRLDLWLWAARFYKTRSLARQAIETGKVELAGQRAKAARALRWATRCA